MIARRAVVTTEATWAPVLLSLYDEAGMVGRMELSAAAAIRLAHDLLAAAGTKLEAR